jgi:alpha-mannosidase
VTDAAKTEKPRSEEVRTVAVVPHTHWDREWYLPFEGFRARLVEMLDEFLPRLEADPSYARFLLDGQMAVVDDYLELRPHAEPVLRRLGASGRLGMGPWYILMDEFLVSGETIIRNLQVGQERAAAFGGAMPVGYLPDMFGHIAQMPQILKLAGLDHAVVWRGVPSTVDRTAFWWQAPDGSTVRAEYLPTGYANGAAIPEDAKALVRRLQAYQQELSPRLHPTDPILWMNGTDHQVPQPWLGRVIAETNALQDQYHVAITSLAEYLDQAPTDGLPSWTGELRSGARANLLMGVASNRVDVRQAAAGAERALERQAEPLSALWLAPDQWPEAELNLGWLHLIRNSAHDSICACSADEVTLAVVDRFAQATALAGALTHKALRNVTLSADGPVIVNSSSRARDGVVELIVPGDEPVEGAQVVEHVASAVRTVTGLGAELGPIFGQLEDEGFSNHFSVLSLETDVSDSGVEVTIHTGRGQQGVINASPLRSEAYAVAGANRDRPLRVTVERDGWQKVAVHAPDVAGFGWARWQPGALTVPPVKIADTSLDNGLVHVDVAVDGTFAVNGQAGFNRLVDGGDEGDTYNYSPPAGDLEVDRPAKVEIQPIEGGPVRGRIRVTRTYRWPLRVQDGQRVGESMTDVVSDIELRVGESFVRVTTTFDNRSRDHRLRALFPLPETAVCSYAECAFAIVERGLTAEGGPHEYGLPTRPARRFVSAGGLTVLHDRVLEYEVVDGGQALAITLLRATGMLSRNHPAFRPNSAGPALPVEGPQLLGMVSVRYAVHVGSDDPYAMADQAWLPLEVAQSSGGGSRPDRGSELSVSGAEVSSLRRVAGRIEVRVYNPTNQEASVVIEGHSGWLVDLRGRPLEPFDGTFPLRPWGIATARL